MERLVNLLVLILIASSIYGVLFGNFELFRGCNDSTDVIKFNTRLLWDGACQSSDIKVVNWAIVNTSSTKTVLVKVKKSTYYYSDHIYYTENGTAVSYEVICSHADRYRSCDIKPDYSSTFVLELKPGEVQNRCGGNSSGTFYGYELIRERVKE